MHLAICDDRLRLQRKMDCAACSSSGSLSAALHAGRRRARMTVPLPGVPTSKAQRTKARDQVLFLEARRAARRRSEVDLTVSARAPYVEGKLLERFSERGEPAARRCSVLSFTWKAILGEGGGIALAGFDSHHESRRSDGVTA